MVGDTLGDSLPIMFMFSFLFMHLSGLTVYYVY